MPSQALTFQNFHNNVNKYRSFTTQPTLVPTVTSNILIIFPKNSPLPSRDLITFEENAQTLLPGPRTPLPLPSQPFML